MNDIYQLLSQPHWIRFGWSLIHILWQGLAIAALLEIALFFIRPKNASLRYILCAFALALFPICLIGTYGFLGQHQHHPAVAVLPPDQFLPPLPAQPTLSSPPPSPLFPPPLQSSVRNSVPSLPLDLNPYIPAIVAIWFAGVVLLAGRKAGGFYIIWRLRHRCLTLPTDALLDQFRRVCQRLGIDPNRVALKISSLVNVPLTMGWLKPIVLLPATLISGLTPDEIELILAHELAHIRRHDYLVNLLQTVIETLFFYHPVTWWISRRMKQERENACDDLIASEPSAVLAYAKVLVRLETIRPAGTSLVSAANGGSLLQRIQRLLGEPTAPPAISLPSIVLLIGLLLALLAAPLLKAEQAAAKKAAPKTETSAPGVPPVSMTLDEAKRQGIVAVVNQLTITEASLEQQTAATEKALSDNFTGKELSERILEARRSTLRALIDRELIIEDFKSQGGKISGEYVKARIADIVKDQYGGDRETFLKSLVARHVTLETYQKEIEDNAIISYSRTKYVVDPVWQYYQSHLDLFPQDEQINVTLITIPLDPAKLLSDHDHDPQYALAQEVLDQAKKGADFSALATKYDKKVFDVGPTFWVTQEDLGSFVTFPQVWQAIEKLQPGQTSDLIETNLFYGIARVTDRRAARIPATAKSTEQRKTLLAREAISLEEEWFASLRTKARIQVFIGEDRGFNHSHRDPIKDVTPDTTTPLVTPTVATAPASEPSAQPSPARPDSVKSLDDTIALHDLKDVKAALDKGVEPDSLNMAQALFYGHNDTAKLLWEHNPHLCSPIAYAISQGASAADAEALLQKGTPVQPPEDAYLSPLTVAILNRNKPVFDLLLKHGADPNWHGKDITREASSLYCAMGMPDYVTALLDHGAKIPLSMTFMAFWHPIGSDDIASLKLLADRGVFDRLAPKLRGPYLYLASLAQSPDTVRLLLAHGFSANDVGPDGKTKVVDLIRRLVNGQDTAPPSPAYQPVLDVLAADLSTPTTAAGINPAAVPDASYRLPTLDERLASVLHSSDDLFDDHPEVDVVASLLSQGASPNAKESSGFPAFVWALCYGKDDAAVMLLRHGADPNAVDTTTDTRAIWYASSFLCCPKALEVLIQKGVDVNSADAKGRTPLDAVTSGQVKPAGTKIRDKVLSEADSQAWSARQLRCFDLLAAAGADLNGHDGATTPLMNAIRSHNYEIARVLLDHNVHVDYRDQYGENALGYLFEWGSQPFPVDVIETLLKRGCDPNRSGTSKPTDIILELAMMLSPATDAKGVPLFPYDPAPVRAVIKLLLKYGADPTIKNAQGETPIDIAKKHHPEFLDLFPSTSPDPAPKSETNAQSPAKEDSASTVRLALTWQRIPEADYRAHRAEIDAAVASADLATIRRLYANFTWTSGFVSAPYGQLVVFSYKQADLVKHIVSNLTAKPSQEKIAIDGTLYVNVVEKWVMPTGATEARPTIKTEQAKITTALTLGQVTPIQPAGILEPSPSPNSKPTQRLFFFLTATSGTDKDNSTNATDATGSSKVAGVDSAPESETSTPPPAAPAAAAPDQPTATAGKDAPKMIRLGMKVVQLGEDDYQAHRADIEAALGKGDVEPLSKLASFNLLSEPAVLMQSGEQGVLEAVRVMPVPVKFNRDSNGKLVPTDYEHRNIGVRLPLQVSNSGDTIDLNGKLEVTTFQGYIDAGGKSFQPCFNAYETYFVQQMPSGTTRGLEVAGTQVSVPEAAAVPGHGQPVDPAAPPKLARLFLFVTAQLYTRDGKPIPPSPAAQSTPDNGPTIVGNPRALPALAAAASALNPAPDPSPAGGVDVSLKLTLPPQARPDFAQSRGDLISSDKVDYTMTADANGIFTAHHIPPGTYDEMIRLGRKSNNVTVFTTSSFGPVVVGTKNNLSQLAWDPAGVSPPKGEVQIDVRVAQFDEDAYAANKNKIDAAVDKGDLPAFVDLINNLPGVSLISAPSVSTKPGLKADIDIVREFPYPTEFDEPKVVHGLTANAAYNVPPTPREFVTKDIGISAEITPVLVTESVSPHGSIILNGKFTLATFEGFTKSNLVGTGMPSFSTSESHFVEALKSNGSCGLWIPGSHFAESDARGKLPSGRTIAPNTTMKQRMVLFLTATLTK